MDSQEASDYSSACEDQGSFPDDQVGTRENKQLRLYCKLLKQELENERKKKLAKKQKPAREAENLRRGKERAGEEGRLAG